MTDTAVPPADPFRHTEKQRSWDEFGSQYWTMAANTSHPSAAETGAFLHGASPGRHVLVLGATTTEVIRAAVGTGADVHVLDFAGRLLDLVGQEFGDSVTRHRHDLLDPVPDDLAGRFDVVVADRLVNRFHRSEMPRVVANMMRLVAPGGRLHISVRFGLYPLDRRLIEIGTELGTLRNYWDPESRTIDWSGVKTELDRCAEAHGAIPREVVIAWSKMRGVESRLEPEDVPRIVAEASAGSDAIVIRDVADMDVAPRSKIFVLTHDVPPEPGDRRGGGRHGGQDHHSRCQEAWVTCDGRPPAGQAEDRGPGLATADRPAAEPRAQVQAVIEDVLGCRLDWDDPTMGFRLRPEWGSFEQVRILGRLQELYGVGRFAGDLTLLTTPQQILAAVTDRTPGDTTPPAPAAPGASAGGADPAVEVDLGLARTVMDKTAITDIDPAGSRLCYRGHDVSTLAAFHTYDAVARLLIDGQLAQLDDDRRGLLAEGAFLARSAGLLWSGSHEDFVACFARLDLAGGQERSPDDVRRQGWRLLGAAAQLASRSADAPTPPDDSIAAQVAAPATAATDGPTDDVVAGLTMLMILQADHGSSAAALAVRTAVSAGAGLHAALLAGLVTFGGHRHGGALADVVRLVEDIGDVDALGIAVRSSIERGVPVPGFGHRIYSVTDPRVEPIRQLLVQAEERRRTVWWSERLRHIREAHAALERSGAVANVDFYAGPLLRTYGFETQSLTTLFAVARIAGWVAHAVEQTERRTLIRPKLEYVGVRPEESCP